MQIGVSITKSVVFRNSVQEFSNVYHYEVPGGGVGPVAAEAIIDRIVVLEKTWHSTGVSFKAAKCWSSGGTVAQNVMIFQKLLTGTGSVAVSAAMDKERAFLFQWPAGFDSRGHPVKLKKWYHSCCNFPGVAIGNPELTNEDSISQSERDSAETTVSAIHPLVVSALAGSFDLVAESGREIDGSVELHKYLEHHQLGDMWRG